SRRTSTTRPPLRIIRSFTPRSIESCCWPRSLKGWANPTYQLCYSLAWRSIVARRAKGLGKALLKDAVLRTMQAAEIAGLKLLLVLAKDDAAAAFYQKHGFVSLPN